jgi:hypothetical protein
MVSPHTCPRAQRSPHPSVESSPSVTINNAPRDEHMNIYLQMEGRMRQQGAARTIMPEATCINNTNETSVTLRKQLQKD